MKFISKLKEFIALVKRVKEENVESIMLDFENLNKKAENIFDEVSTDKDFSIYRLELLEKQISFIEETKNMHFNSFIKYGKDLREFNNKVFWISLIIILISVILLFFASILAYIPGVFIFSVLTNYRLKLSREYVDKSENFLKMSQNLKNTLISCGNFIGDKKVKKLDQIENSRRSKVYSKELLASHLVSVYIETGELLDAPKDVIDCAIEMLQCDLATNENNLIILLAQARLKISEENLNAELARFRSKNDH